MLPSVVRFSLRFRGVVLALGVVVAGYGAYRLTQAPYDVFPRFAPPRVQIQTEAPGLTPQQVEQLVTLPVEGAVNGASGIDTMRSSSMQGLSLITVIFDPATDIYRDRQAISERLASVGGALPAGVRAPVMTPLTSPTGTVLVLGLTSDQRSLMDLRTIAYWTLRRRLLAVKGVSSVAVYGGRVRQFQVQIHPRRLARYHLSVAQVVAAARRATAVRGAGVIDTPNQRIDVYSDGQGLTAAQLGDTLLADYRGVPVTLGQVADVRVAPPPPVGAALINGREGIQMDISAQYGANTLQVTRRVERELAALRPMLERQSIHLFPHLFRPAAFIHRAVGNVRTALVAGALLVAVVLSLFLFNLRAAAISLTAIPLSLLAGTAVLELLGYSLNTMTLGGLAIAIGLLVDDAVITVENISRRLRENLARQTPRRHMAVVRDATLEVRSAVVYATLAVAMVFLPVLTLSGVAGRLFGPLAVAYILATLASLATAVTVTPALCAVLIDPRRLRAADPPLIRWLKGGYGRLLHWVEPRYRLVIAAALLFTAVGIALLPFFGARFIPELKEGHYIVHMVMAAGSSLGQSLALGKSVTRTLDRLPYVRSVTQRVGRAEQSQDVYGTNVSEFDVDLKPLNGEQAQHARRAIRAALAGIPGADFTVNTFLVETIEETVLGQLAPVAVNVYGDDLDVLAAKARQIASVLRGLPGAVDVRQLVQPNAPRLDIHLRHDAMVRWGLHPADVLDALHTAYSENIVGQVYDGDRVFDVAVILAPDERRVSQVAALPLTNGDGTYVRLGQVARIHMSSGRRQVLHNDGQRVQTVTANVVGYDVGRFVKGVRAAIDNEVAMPPGTYLDIRSTAQAQAEARDRLLLYSAIAIIFIVLLLSLVLARLRNLALILLNLPFALVGGVLAILVLGGTVSMGAMVGFVTLFGITLRNAIMLIAHYEHLVWVEGSPWNLETAVRGAKERLAPILITALVTAFGLLPLALTREAPGNAIEGPMAVVILGGLLTSTALNLLVLPSIALRYGRFSRSGAAPRRVGPSEPSDS